MRRRKFITLVGATAAWPLVAQAQQSERLRRIGVLVPFATDDPEGQARIAAFVQELQRLGWADGRNVEIVYRRDTGDLRKAATELATSSLDVILANTAQAARRSGTQRLFASQQPWRTNC